MRLVIGAVGIACRFDLCGRSGQTDHLGVHVGGEIPNNFRGISGGIDRDEHRRCRNPARFQFIDGAGVPVYVQRANIRAEGITKVNEAGFGDHIRVRHGLALRIHQLERPAQFGTTGHGRVFALRVFVAVAIGPVDEHQGHRQKGQNDQHRTNCHYSSHIHSPARLGALDPGRTQTYAFPLST